MSGVDEFKPLERNMLSPSIAANLPPPSDSPVQTSMGKTGNVPDLGAARMVSVASNVARIESQSSGGSNGFQMAPSVGGFGRHASVEGGRFGRYATSAAPSMGAMDERLTSTVGRSGSGEPDDMLTQVMMSWKMIEANIDKAGRIFFLKVFEMCPEMLQHFSFRDDEPLENSEGLQRHGRAVMEIVGQAVQSLNNLNDLVASFRQLVARHIQYGVQPKYLEFVGRALLKTVEEWLGDAWTEELEEAWYISWTAIESMFKTFLAEEQSRLESVAKELEDAKNKPSAATPANKTTAEFSADAMAEREARSARWNCVAFSGEHAQEKGATSPQPSTTTTLFSTTCKPLRLLHGRFVPIAVHGKDGKKTTVNMAGLVVVAGGRAGCSVMLYDKAKRLLSQATLTSQGGEMQVDSRDGVALELRDDRKQLWRLRLKDAQARAALLSRYALAESTVWGADGAHLVKVDLNLGSGKVLQPGDLARLRYKMWEVEGGEQGNPTLGDMVDENEGEGEGEELLTFWVGSSSVMVGLDQGVVGMRQGGVRMVVIPPHLGHGPAGVTHKFGAYATLAMEVRLVDDKEALAVSGGSSQGMVTPAGTGERGQLLGAWTHPPHRGGSAEDENSPIEVSLHPLGSAVRNQGVQPLTEFSSRKSLDGVSQKIEGLDGGLLSPDEDTPPSHGSHEGATTTAGTAQEENIAVQLFAKGEGASEIKGMVDHAVSEIISGVTAKLKEELGEREILESAASTLLTCGKEVLVRQHSPRTMRTRTKSDEGDVINVAESEEPEETAASLLVCGYEMAVRTPRKLDPSGSAGDGERRAAKDDMDTSMRDDDSDEEVVFNQQTPRLHTTARVRGGVEGWYAEAGAEEEQGGSEAGSAHSELSARIQEIENRLRQGAGPEDKNGGGGASQRISDMVFGFVFPDAKKMGIPERMSEWGKDSSTKNTPREGYADPRSALADGVTRRLDLLGGVEPEQLKEAMLRSVQGVGLADEVVTSAIVQQCMDRIVQEASRRAAAVLEASFSAGVLDMGQEGSQVEKTVIAEPVQGQGGPAKGEAFHLFDSQADQELRAAAAARTKRPDSSWISAGNDADESFTHKLEEGPGPIVDLESSVLEGDPARGFRGKSLSDSAARGRPGVNASTDSSRTDDRAVLDLKASLAGDLARILASVGACRREGLGIRDHVMEAFGEALVRVRDGMVHAQAGLGQEVRQSVAAHEEALAAVRERVGEVQRDARAVREAVDGWKAELQGRLKQELGEYHASVRSEVEACRSEVQGLKAAILHELASIRPVSPSLPHAHAQALNDIAATVEGMRGELGELKREVGEGLAGRAAGEASLRAMVVGVASEGKQAGEAVHACRRDIQELAVSLNGQEVKEGQRELLEKVEARTREALSAQAAALTEKLAAAQHHTLQAAVQAVKVELEGLGASLASSAARDLAARDLAARDLAARDLAALKDAALAEHKLHASQVLGEVELVRKEVAAAQAKVAEEQARGAERLREELATVGAQVAGLAVPKGEGGFTEAFVDEYKRQGSGVKDRVEGLQKQVEELKQVVVGEYRNGQGTRSDVEAARAEIKAARAEIKELAARVAQFKEETAGVRSALLEQYNKGTEGVTTQVGAVRAEVAVLKSTMEAEGQRRGQEVQKAVQGNSVKDEVEVIRRAVGEMKTLYMDEQRRESQETRNEVTAFRTEVRGLVDAVLDTYMTETQGLKAAVEKEYRRDAQGVRDEVEQCSRKVDELTRVIAGGSQTERGTRGDVEACRSDVQELAEKVGGIRSDTNAIKEALVEEYKKAGEGMKSEVDLVRKDIQGVIAAMGEEYRKGEQELKEVLKGLSTSGDGAAVPAAVVEGVKGEVENVRRAVLEMKTAIVEAYQSEGAKNREEMGTFKAETRSLVQSLQGGGGAIKKEELLQELKREREQSKGEVEAVSKKVEELKEEIKVEYRKESKLMREGVGAVLAREVANKVPEAMREASASQDLNRSLQSISQDDVAEACRTEVRNEVQPIREGQQRVLEWIDRAEERGLLPEERNTYKAELQQMRLSLVREQSARAELEKDLLEARKVLARERKRWAANLREAPSHNTSTGSETLDPNSPAGLAQGLTNSLRSVRDKLRDKIPDEDWYEDDSSAEGVTPPPERSAPTKAAASGSPVPQLRLDKLNPSPPQPAAKTSQRARNSPPPEIVPPPALSGSRASTQPPSRTGSEPPQPEAERGEEGTWTGSALLRTVAGSPPMPAQPVRLGEDTSTGTPRKE